MNKLPSNPSKAAEMAHWEEFLSQLPTDSYLASYLQDSIPMMREAMANDMHCDALAELRKQRATAAQDVTDVRQLLYKLNEERAVLTTALIGMRKDVSRLTDAFDDARSAARMLLTEADKAHAFGMVSIARASK